MGSLYIIHASLTEYLIIFGTPVGTEGHSGRHTADDYFHILHGEQTAYKAGALVKEVSLTCVCSMSTRPPLTPCASCQVYPPGSMHLMRRGEVKQYKFHEGGWAMEYARGASSSFLLRLPVLTSDYFQA